MIEHVEIFKYKPGDTIIIDDRPCVLTQDENDIEVYKGKVFKIWAAYCEEVHGYYSFVEMLNTRQ